jgi:hypothetical protein
MNIWASIGAIDDCGDVNRDEMPPEPTIIDTVMALLFRILNFIGYAYRTN